jgi:23S rRNA pseudouridine2605 synthase
MEERLQKILARAGYGSRRSSEDLITAGRVLVNGKLAELGQKADAAKDKIEVDRSPIPQAKPMLYYAFNKPRFVLCDKVLGDTRRTVFDLVPNGEELSIVGRLDFESEGLVILTNDGEMVNRLTHPRYEHEKEYRVLLASRPDAKQLEAWRRGIILEDGHRTSAVNVKIEMTLGKGAWLRIVMKEGHKRQIRETAKTLGLFVIRIVRVRIGGLHLGNLKSGEWKELTAEDIDLLKSTNSGATLKRNNYSKKTFAEKKTGSRQSTNSNQKKSSSSQKMNQNYNRTSSSQKRSSPSHDNRTGSNRKANPFPRSKRRPE